VNEPRRPLHGVRVLDLSRLAPGPYCSMLLADLGAAVVMVGGGRTGAPIPVLESTRSAWTSRPPTAGPSSTGWSPAPTS
jgi:alpha-methylacyl-CoA racemase